MTDIRMLKPISCTTSMLRSFKENLLVFSKYIFRLYCSFHLLTSNLFFCRYFSMQALQPVGFDDKIRFEVEMNICREGGPLPDCFSGPMKIVLKSLEKVALID